MKTYKSINEAVAELKLKTGHGRVLYFVDGLNVCAGTYRTAEGSELIYRSGFEIHAEKTTKQK
ncbi:hypothetical protein [uncultured Alistipes sp.]|uniref:hypothetical protein n=1 Tax=uncultured Alistipes sp. TaxID=538949 RepID=UPI00272A5060|nr:hypothetical protein [uncultured Alistipes sp.]